MCVGGGDDYLISITDVTHFNNVNLTGYFTIFRAKSCLLSVFLRTLQHFDYVTVCQSVIHVSDSFLFDLSTFPIQLPR